MEGEPLDHRLGRFILEKATKLNKFLALIQFDDVDAMFSNLQINAPLEHLVVTNISDSSLDSIIQLANTLKMLDIRRSNKITTDG